MILSISIPADFWTMLLVLGILAMFATTVSMILGHTPGKGGGRKHARHDASGHHAVTPLRVATANAARERASAAARAKAEAAARHRAIHLTDVRELPAGQTDEVVHRLATEHAVTPEEAQAIFAHYAEHDPHRLAEVITQWIRSDMSSGVNTATGDVS